MLKNLSLETLAELDPKAGEAFARHMKRAGDDCYDRPGDKAARKVTLEVVVAPVMDASGACGEANVQIKVSSTVPKHQTKVFSASLLPSGALKFNPDSPDCVDQKTLMDDDGE